MTHEIWQDLKIRLENVRADMVGQWQGELENHAIEQSVMVLGTAIVQWTQAEPVQTVPPLTEQP